MQRNYQNEMNIIDQKHNVKIQAINDQIEDNDNKFKKAFNDIKEEHKNNMDLLEKDYQRNINKINENNYNYMNQRQPYNLNFFNYPNNDFNLIDI